MNKKEFRGEYIAPVAKLVEMQVQHMIATSAKIDMDDNLFEDNDEE